MLEEKKGDNSPKSPDAGDASDAETFSYLDSIKSLLLISLPHCAIGLLFVVYVLVGAAILKEIESEGPGQLVVAEPTAGLATSRLQYDKEIEMAALRLADTQRSNLNKLLADARVQYAQLDAVNKKLVGSFSEMVIRSLNLTNYYRDQAGQLVAKKPPAAAVVNKPIGKKGKKGEDVDDDLADLNETVDQRETIRFISSQLNLNKNALISAADKSKKKKKTTRAAATEHQINSKQVLRSIAEHLINHKLQLKVSIVEQAKALAAAHHKEQLKAEQSLQKLVADYNDRLKASNDHFLSEVVRLTAKFNSEPSSAMTTPPPAPVVKKQPAKKWTMQNSIYFVGTLLTTIGYGDICPQSLFGKLFTMVYLFIGLPLTLLLLADLGTILTRFIKFLHLFLLILYRDGYYEQFGQQLRSKVPFLGVFSFLFFLKSSRKQRTGSAQRTPAPGGKKSSTNSDDDPPAGDTGNYDENENVYANANQPGIFRSLFEIAMSCLEQADDKFNIKLSSLFGLVFVYVTLGAVVTARYAADWSILDGYYFCVTTLTRIGFGDLTVDNPRFMLVTSFYSLFGLALFMLTMQTLQEKLRLQFIANGRRIVDELIKFVSQFGYSPNADDIHMNLAAFCKGPRIVDSSLGDASAPLTPSKAVAASVGAFNLAATFSNGLSASTSTPNIAGAGAGYMLDDDELFLSSVNLNQLARNSAYLMNNQLMRRRATTNRRSNLFFRDLGELKAFKAFEMANKCDKQTQITTLLCSKFKYDKEAAEQASSAFGSAHDQTAEPSDGARSNVASVKPSVFYQTGEDELKRPSTIREEEEEVTVFKLSSKIPTILKSSPLAAPEAATKPNAEAEATSVTSLSRPPVRRNRFGALASDTTTTTTIATNTTAAVDQRTYSFKR